MVFTSASLLPSDSADEKAKNMKIRFNTNRVILLEGYWKGTYQATSSPGPTPKNRERAGPRNEAGATASSTYYIT